MFHEKQQGSYCRMHAINNLIGYALYDASSFDALCDLFDAKHNFERCTRDLHIVFNNGGTDNIFGFAFESKRIHVDMCTERKGPWDRLLGCIAFSNTHAWAVRCDSHQCHVIDSMNPRIVTLPLNSIDQQGISRIFVYTN